MPSAGSKSRTYILRMQKFSDYHPKVATVYSDDWYVGALGFRSYYSLDSSSNGVKIGLNMCSFPSDGFTGTQTSIKYKISIMDPSGKDPDWLLQEKTLYCYEEWARGVEVTVTFRELTARGYVKNFGPFMIRYDVHDQT